MRYDDEARRFNFISGLVCGVILGSGLALIAAPRTARRRSGSLLEAARRSRRRHPPRLARLRDELANVRARAEGAAERVQPKKHGRVRRALRVDEPMEA